MNPRTTKNFLFALGQTLAMISAISAPAPALAHEKEGVRGETPVVEGEMSSHEPGEAERAPAATPKPSVPCGNLESFTGDLQLLDPSRTLLVDPRKGAPILCGGWVSVGQGSALIRHRTGALLRLGASTFAQLLESTRPGGNADQRGDLVLYHGQVYATGGEGRGGVQVATPNARATVNRGSALVIYDRDREESQAVALDGTVNFENRFEVSRQVELKKGEGSSLNFQLLRVIPSAPRAVSVPGMRARLAELKLDPNERAAAMKAVSDRAARKFASHLDDSAGKPKRDIAAVEESAHVAQRNSDYARNPASADAGAPSFNGEMVNRLVGGGPSGKDIAFPKSSHKPASKGRVQVIDRHAGDAPDGRDAKAEAPRESAEKKHLIEELSKIHED